MKLIFMGTPQFSVTALAALIDAGHNIVCVYAQPPRPSGRGMTLRPTAVHAYAEAKGIEVRTPVSLKSTEEQIRFATLQADAAVVVAYGLLLPKAVLDAPKFGCFNIHASLLPRWRGAAPIQRSIMAGDAETGVTIMRMEAGLDTGPMLKVGRVKIKPDTTYASLYDELAAMGAKLIVEALQSPSAHGTVQPRDGVTYAKKIDKVEAKLELSKSPMEICNQINGLSPFPGAWCFINGTRVKILKARVAVDSNDGKLVRMCGDGWIELLTLQREGKGPMDATNFLQGFPIANDAVFS